MATNGNNSPDSPISIDDLMTFKYGAQIDALSRQSGLGQLSQAAANALFGINHRGFGNPIPHNTDNQGLTFFTRPRLNLTYDNLAADRVMTTLMDRNLTSYQRAVRVMLDPVSGGKTVGRAMKPPTDTDAVTCPLIDNDLPFMAMLSNHLIDISGWPDPTAPTYTSHEGVQREAWFMVDGIVQDYSVQTLTATFNNIAGDPISLLFNAWIRYASNVYMGTMYPYPDVIVENEIDYQTRIYRLVLDPSRTFVTKISACGAAAPTAVSLGSAFTYSTDQPFNESNKQISVPFLCAGFMYNDPILIKEFNTIVAVYNPNMIGNPLSHGMIQVHKSQLQFFNYHGYPRIDPVTSELQWWVTAADYADIANVKIYSPSPSI
jgi:hypothetical protein